MAAVGQARHNHLGRAARLQVSARVRKAHNRIGVGDVNVFGMRPGRIKGDPERPMEAGGEDDALRG
jgi:hypothetical protein